ncbi:phage tail sheath C-terminal domain-containing protein [uncultured Shewanella sp.]|uniref:phage tail sheath family protein n=1 Tax=uncultured Shewanella sp. TaxID=173975 RepID=UPI0026323A98|nr:phage tail sheath C-terminal domain-containing protein [uncultured Shewanella sp.]
MTMSDYSSATASISASGFTFSAANPGVWGNNISVSLDQNGITDQVASIYQQADGVAKNDLFNLTVLDNGKPVETFKCVTVKGGNNSAIRVDQTLAHESNYIRITGNLPKSTPSFPKTTPSVINTNTMTGGKDSPLLSDSDDYLGEEDIRTGLYALSTVDIFNMLCIPPDPGTDDGGTADTLMAINSAAAVFCEKKRALFIAEPLDAWTDKAKTGQWPNIQPTDLGINGDTGRYACTYFPKVKLPDPNMQDRERVFSSCGVIAGVMATNDLNRGVWKAPAGQNAGMVGVTGLEVKVNNDDNGFLNPLGINCLRDFPVIGPVVWGDRTLRGADLLSDDYKYISVRRLTNYIEVSLQRGTQWAVFEDNDESLWSQLRLSIGAFMKELATQGAFYNYKVICDASTTTPDDIAKGVVNVEILFAPVKPAEFVVLKFQQTVATI